MVTLSPSFFSETSPRDSIERHLSSMFGTFSRNFDSVQEATSNNSYPVVQYRRSGQYRRYPTVGDQDPKLDLPTQTFRHQTKRLKPLAEMIDLNSSSDDDEFDEFVETVKSETSVAATNVATYNTVESSNDETRAGNEASSKKRDCTKNESLLKALRDLYHTGQTPSREEISSFSTALSHDDDEKCSQPNDDSCAKKKKKKKKKKRKRKFEDGEYDFSYNSLETSLYFSEDLVVEWQQ